MNNYETPVDEEYDEKVIALAEYFDIDIDSITVSRYDNTAYETKEGEYIVLDDEGADELAYELIMDLLWAFNAEFIIDNTKLPYEAIDMISDFQNEKCEGANDTIYALIDDPQEFADAAIAADGRGHFIGSCDGDEIEYGDYFFYRTG